MTPQILLSALTLMAQPPQPAPQPPADPSEVAPVVVTAQPFTEPAPEAIMDGFMEALARPRKEGQIARWNDPICPKARGGSRETNLYLEKRVREVAESLDLQTGWRRCTPNVRIVLAKDANHLLKLLRRGHSFRMFSGFSRSEIDDFMRTPRPVRWWRVLQTSPAGRGRGAKEDNLNSAAAGFSPTFTGPAGAGPMASGPVLSAPTMRASNSRLRVSTQRDFSHVVVVIDQASTRDVPPHALSSYVAMAALAELKMDSDVEGARSVLNLFRDRDAGREPARDLTAWDRAFLRGVYEAPANLARSRQRNAIQARMAKAYREESQ